MRHLRFAAALSNKAIELESAGNLDGAVAALSEAVLIDPGLAEAWSNLGNVRRAQSRSNEAVACYNRALELKPDFADARSNLAAALLDLDQWELAKEHCEKALALKPEYAEALNNLGNAYMGLGDPSTACDCYEQAVAYKRDYANTHNNFGNALKELGDFDGARKHYDRAIQIKPDYAEAHYNRSELIKYNLAAVEQLEDRIMDSPQPPSPYWSFAIAKAYEDIGRYDLAWGHWTHGNRRKRDSIGYDEAGALQVIERVKRVFTPELFERFKESGDPSLRPIFIVGFPRCGSTLVEQILSSHPQIHGAGELTTFFQNPITTSKAMLKLGAQNYLAGLPATPKPYIIDKLLGNFLRVGLIKLTLPNAKIIHVVRNPLDTCLSCYQHLFTRGVLFSYDLAELGRYYRAYESLMVYWRDVLPGFVTDVEYESVLSNFEPAVRYLLEEIIGVDFDPACLEFQNNPRPVRTASVVQVRRPLFKTSVDKWRKYEFGLQPLKEALGLNAG